MMFKTVILLLLAFYIFSFSFQTDHSFDQDLGRHIKLGEIIYQTKSIPDNNLFSYTHPDFPFVNHHWLFEVIVYLGINNLGIQTLLWIKLLFLIISGVLVLTTINKEKIALSLPLGFLFLHLLRERVELRPEIFSYLYSSLSLFILEKFDQQPKTKLVWLLPFIQMLWINTHIYFLVGLALQGIYIIHLYFQKRQPELRKLVIILGLSLLASLVNPHNIAGLLYPLTIFGNYGYSIVENQTIFTLESIGFYSSSFLFAKLAVGVAGIVILIGLFNRSLSIKNTLLIFTGLILSILNVRSFPYLPLLVLPALINSLGKFNFNYLTTTLLVISSFLLIFEAVYYLNGSYYRLNDSDKEVQLVASEHLKGGMDFVLNHNLPQPIFNNFDIGSYISYRGYPEYKVFVDGRPEAYPKEFFQMTYIPIQSNIDLFKKLSDELNLQTIIFSHTDQTPWGKSFLKQITNHPKWRTIYIDDTLIILTRTEYLANLNVPEISLDQLDPNFYNYSNHTSYLKLAIFLLNNGNLSSAQKFATAAYRLEPQSPLANRFFSRAKPNNIWW